MKQKLLINLLIVFSLTTVTLQGRWRSLPTGVSIESSFYNVSDNDIEFLYDLTSNPNSVRKIDQSIFTKVYEMIDSAEQLIVIDFFLFGYATYEENPDYINVTGDLTAKLIEKRNKYPEMPIYFITDEFNIFYYSYFPHHLEMLRENSINIIITDMTRMPDSNWLYSKFWHFLPRWFGKPKYKGWLPNFFGDPDNKVAVRSMLRLLNFKANHRKVVITEKQALITSANPHTASSLHSNIAFTVKGELINEILDSEREIAKLSKDRIDISWQGNKTSGPIKVKYITESKIRKNLIREINKTTVNDSIDVGMFYLSDRKVIKALKQALKRKTLIRLLLDPNKDAFGKQKKGIPNRQVASELYKSGAEIRWANTHGEQFHTKLIIITKNDSITIMGGSANLTRRNLGDYNLESDLQVLAHRNTQIVKKVKSYFNLVWKSNPYTLDYEEYDDTSKLKYLRYRFQEWSGMGTF